MLYFFLTKLITAAITFVNTLALGLSPYIMHRSLYMFPCHRNFVYLASGSWSGRATYASLKSMEVKKKPELIQP